MRATLMAISLIFLYGCNGTTKPTVKFENKGVAIVLNGRNQLDSLNYTCDSCVEIIQDKKVFDSIISIATSEAKDLLKNKLSFIPSSVNLEASHLNNLHYVDGSKIDSLVTVVATYICIGKNGYGVEDEVKSTSLIYLINNKVKDLDGKIKKQPLEFSKEGVASRNLSLYDDNDNILIQPIKSDQGIHLIVSTNESCVENARLEITFNDNDKLSLRSWNKFNCKSNSYFQLNKSDLEILKTKPIRYVSFSEENFVFCSVPENNRDYLMQFANLVE